jgi:hypothetical protein
MSRRFPPPKDDSQQSRGYIHVIFNTPCRRHWTWKTIFPSKSDAKTGLPTIGWRAALRCNKISEMLLGECYMRKKQHNTTKCNPVIDSFTREESRINAQ